MNIFWPKPFGINQLISNCTNTFIFPELYIIVFTWNICLFIGEAHLSCFSEATSFVCTEKFDDFHVSLTILRKWPIISKNECMKYIILSKSSTYLFKWNIFKLFVHFVLKSLLLKSHFMSIIIQYRIIIRIYLNLELQNIYKLRSFEWWYEIKNDIYMYLKGIHVSHFLKIIKDKYT